MNTDIIELIHQSDLYCDISEVGAGVGLSHSLLSVPGASNTVNRSYCNYSKESQSVYEHEGRSVSIEALESQLDYMWDRKGEKVNTLIANSFQIIDGGCTHGWVGIDSETVGRMYFHFTLPNVSRIESIDLVSDIMLKLLLFCVDGNQENIPIQYCDGIFDYSMMFDDIIFDLEIQTFICFNSEGEWERFETIYRDKSINFYMGSFNPLHAGHKFIASSHNNTALVITVRNFDKDSIDGIEVRRRLNSLKGNQVIISGSPLFSDQLEILKSRHPEDNVVSMGYDTYVRCDVDLFIQNLPIQFQIFNRDNKMPQKALYTNTKFVRDNDYQEMSSTEIRKNNQL